MFDQHVYVWWNPVRKHKESKTLRNKHDVKYEQVQKVICLSHLVRWCSTTAFTKPSQKHTQDLSQEHSQKHSQKYLRTHPRKHAQIHSQSLHRITHKSIHTSSSEACTEALTTVLTEAPTKTHAQTNQKQFNMLQDTRLPQRDPWITSQENKDSR